MSLTSKFATLSAASPYSPVQYEIPPEMCERPINIMNDAFHPTSEYQTSNTDLRHSATKSCHVVPVEILIHLSPSRAWSDADHLSIFADINSVHLRKINKDA